MKFDGMTASVGSGSQRLQFAELGPSAANSNLHGHVGLHDGNRRVDWQAVWGSQSVLLGRGTTGIAWSLTLSVVALGVIGVATSLLSGRGLVYSSTRQAWLGRSPGSYPRRYPFPALKIHVRTSDGGRQQKAA